MNKNHLIYLLMIGINSLILSSPIYSQNNGDPTFFTGQPPLFVGVQTSDTTIAWPNAHYYFTFHLPNNSVESIGQVVIQQEKSPEIINLNIANTYAFKGTQGNRGEALMIKASPSSGGMGVNVVFDPPLPPGTTFTIRVEAFHNPSLDTTYLYDVTAFPAGNNPTSLPMGVGTLRFYRLF